MNQIGRLTAPTNTTPTLWRGRVVELHTDGSIFILIPRLLGESVIQCSSIVSGLTVGDDVVVGLMGRDVGDAVILSLVTPRPLAELAELTIANAPTLAGHATRKDYVDAQVATRALAGHVHAAATTTTAGFLSAADKIKLDAAAAANHTHANATTTVAGFMSGADKTKLDSASVAGHTHTAANITDSTAVGRSVLTAVDALAARGAIGAGTSNLVLGTTATTAKAGDYAPTWDQVTSKPATFTPAAHTHVKADVGLGDVDNTTDLLKPISTATQNALNLKSDNGHTHTAASQTVAGFMAAVDKLKLDNAVSAATASRLVIRDAAGRAAFADPAAAGDAATKGYVDGKGIIRRAEFFGSVGAVGGGSGTYWLMDSMDIAPLTQNNTFAEKSLTATTGVLITESAEYDITGSWFPSVNPGTVTVALYINSSFVDANSEGSYGVWEKGVSASSIYISAGSIIRVTAVSTSGTAYTYRLRVSQGNKA